MRPVALAIAGLVVVSSVGQAQAETARTRRNRERAEARCAERRAAGVECKVSPTVGCGVGWTKDQRFRDGGNAYYTCKRNTYGHDSEENRQECLAWCEARPEECSACSSRLGCGPGFKQIRKFGGPGKNWYACKARHQGNKAACEAWCAENSQCVGCDPSVGCGAGRTSIKKFDDYYHPSATSSFLIWAGETIADVFDGSAWYACRRR